MLWMEKTIIYAKIPCLVRKSHVRTIQKTDSATHSQELTGHPITKDGQS
jgi:hypothetical protein